MAQIPTLIYDPSTKVNGEVHVYYNLGDAVIKKRKWNGGEKNEASCATSKTCPPNSWDATVLRSPGISQFGAFPAYAPVDSAVVGDVSPVDDNVFADVVCLPDWDQNVLICFDSNFQPSEGTQFRAIPRKFNPADHYKRQRSENTMSITDMLISNWDGIRNIHGRPCTIIAVLYPNGGGQPQEVIYYCNVLLTVPKIASATDANASIELAATGNFNFTAVFSAAKP